MTTTNTKQSTDFAKTYRALLLQFAFGQHGYTTENNFRTKSEVRVLRGAFSFLVDLSHSFLPIPNVRRMFPKAAAAEVAWQTQGTKSLDFIQRYTAMWNKFANGENCIETAYGHRWRHHFGRDQLTMGVKALRLNPSNRQVYISAWDPSTDGLGAPNQPPNIPCPVGFSINVIGGQLHMAVFMRSSDVFVGLPYDVMAYSLLCDAIAVSLNLVPGTVHFTLANAHIYQSHFSLLEEALQPENHVFGLRGPVLPVWSLEQIQKNPHDYVNAVGRNSDRTVHHPWNPRPEVVL